MARLEKYCTVQHEMMAPTTPEMPMNMLSSLIESLEVAPDYKIVSKMAVEYTLMIPIPVKLLKSERIMLTQDDLRMFSSVRACHSVSCYCSSPSFWFSY